MGRGQVRAADVSRAAADNSEEKEREKERDRDRDRERGVSKVALMTYFP